MLGVRKLLYVSPKIHTVPEKWQENEVKVKGKGVEICIVPRRKKLTSKRSGTDHVVFTLQTHHTCHYVVSVHQTAPPLTSDSRHLIAAYYSFIDPRRMKGWVGLVCDRRIIGCHVFIGNIRSWSYFAVCYNSTVVWSLLFMLIVIRWNGVITHADSVSRRGYGVRLGLSVYLFVCLSVCPQHNSKTNDPRVVKLDQSLRWTGQAGGLRGRRRRGGGEFGTFWA